jgi:cytochrome c553
MPHLATYVALLHRGEQTLADSLRAVGQGHAKHPDVLFTCQALAALSDDHVRRLAPIAQRYGEQARAEDVQEPERLHAAGLAQTRTGPVGLLRDLQDLHVLASLVQTSWTVVSQAAQGLRDTELHQLATHANSQTSRQLAWLNTRMKAAAPQALIVSS